MNRQIEVIGIVSGKEENKNPEYLVINLTPFQFPGRIVQERETLKDAIDICFFEYGLDTSEIPKRFIKMVDTPGRNLIYVILLECELSDLKEFLRTNTELTLLEKSNLLGESRKWIEELEKKIEKG